MSLKEEFEKYCSNICLNQACPVKIENEDSGKDCFKCELDWYKDELSTSRGIINLKEKVNELNEELLSKERQAKEELLEALRKTWSGRMNCKEANELIAIHRKR